MVTTTSAPITSTNPNTAAATTTINDSRSKLVTNYQTFLTLLTTQLKNQDPTKPLDNNEFTQQLTQMTGVEQQLLSNELLTKLINQGSETVGSAVNLIGKIATVKTNSNMLQAGKADWSYDLPTGITSASIEIKNTSGTVVYTGAVSDLTAGKKTYSWNGITNSGSTLPDGGPYVATITTNNASNVSAKITPSIKGLVTGVENVNGSVLLSLGTNKVPSSAVVGVANAT